MRAVLRLLLVGLMLAMGALCVFIAFPWLGIESRGRIKQRWSAALLAVMGISANSDNLDPADLPAGLVVANHISFLDIFVLNALVPVTFVAKSDIARWPLIGWLTASTGNLFIERGSRQAAHATQKSMADELAAGRRLVIFPEGTSTVGNTVLPFHAALLQSAITSGRLVICLALAYRTRDGKATHAPAYVGNDTLLACLWRIVTCRGIEARVHLAGYLSSAATDRRHLGHHAHQLVSRGLADLQASRVPD